MCVNKFNFRKMLKMGEQNHHLSPYDERESKAEIEKGLTQKMKREKTEWGGKDNKF